MRLPHTREYAKLDVALLGIPFDGGTSYRPGARFAPREIRQHSSLIRPYNPALRVSPFDVLRVADVGDVDVNPIDLEDTYGRVEQAVGEILKANVIPLCVGGDHSLSLPILRAVTKRHGPVGMVHVDSHQDMWEEYFGNQYFHGTPFRRAIEEGLLDTRRVVQIAFRGPVYAETDFDFARQHGIHWITVEQVVGEGLLWVREQMLTVRGGPVYLSFDIDGVDPAFAPGTGTPEVAGLTSREAVDVVRALVGVQLVGADLVEVSPPYDHAGSTSMLAANLLFEMLSVIAATQREDSHRPTGKQ
jgi:guanidinobutyrase